MDNLLMNEYEQHLEYDDAYRKRMRDRNDSQLAPKIKTNGSQKLTAGAYSTITHDNGP